MCIPHNQPFANPKYFIIENTLLLSAAAPIERRASFSPVGKEGRSSGRLAVWPNPCEKSVLECGSEGMHPMRQDWCKPCASCSSPSESLARTEPVVARAWLKGKDRVDSPWAANSSGTFPVYAGDGFNGLYWLPLIHLRGPVTKLSPWAGDWLSVRGISSYLFMHLAMKLETFKQKGSQILPFSL